MNPSQLSANLSQSKHWSESRDLPDPVGLADLRLRPDLVVPLAGFGRSPSEFTAFPWPNTGMKTRSMAVIDPYDELACRVAVAEFILAVDTHLPPRPVVAGYRIGKQPPGWAYRHPGKSHSEHRDRVAALVAADDFGALVVTDVARCYGSIQLPAVAERLMSLVGKHAAVDAVLSWWSIWADRDGCVGLPIGPEWSPAFAHALLGHVDSELVKGGFRHGRWSDDIAIGVPVRGDPCDALALVDEALQMVGLERSVEKTFIHDDPAAALARVRNTALSGLEGMLATGDAKVDGCVHDLFSAAIDMTDGLSSFRFAMRTMKHRKDAWAADQFARDPSLMEIDPATAGSYLSAIAVDHPDAVAGLFCLVAAKPTDRSAAVHLHLMKAASVRLWGAAEGRLFEAVHDDADAPEVLRWWSAEALAATPSFDAERCVADAGSAARNCGSRRLALPARRIADDRQRISCARRIGAVGAHLGPTAAFIERKCEPLS